MDSPPKESWSNWSVDWPRFLVGQPEFCIRKMIFYVCQDRIICPLYKLRHTSPWGKGCDHWASVWQSFPLYQVWFQLARFQMSFGQMLLKSLITVWCAIKVWLKLTWNDEDPFWSIVHFVTMAVSRKFLKRCSLLCRDCGVKQRVLNILQQVWLGCTEYPAHAF